MDQEKFGKFIKEIRKNNNLTQKQLADKYGVTYQAVSKWENGKNMPDIMLIKQMSKDFNIELEDMFEGEYKSAAKKKNNNWMLILLITLLIAFVILLFLLIKSNSEKDFKFKTLTTGCEDFNISGSISYNENKSAIYISHVDYCGGDTEDEYKKIECSLYESHENTDVKIMVDNYNSVCNNYYKDSSLYLLINAIDENNKVTSYKIPLLLEENCSN